jgi:hypothetical protein
MFEKIRNWLKPHPGESPAQAGVAQLRGGSEVPARKPHKPRSEKIVLPVPLSAKDQATADGKPYVTVLQLDIDTANPTLGSFELEWNDVFVKQLMQLGYQGTNDEQIVDQWFQTVCRNVVMETYEQSMADPDNKPTKKTPLGGGRYAAS